MVESLLRSTSIRHGEKYKSILEQLQSINVSIESFQQHVPLFPEEEEENTHGEMKSNLMQLIEMIPEYRFDKAPLRIVSVCASIVYAFSTRFVPSTFGWTYFMVGFCVNFTLALLGFSIMLECICQLSRKYNEAVWFRSICSKQLAQAKQLPYLDISKSWENLLGWLSLRSYLCQRDASHGRINTEIVISTVFVILVPLWLGIIAEITLFESGQLLGFLAMGICLCLSLGIFLLVVVWQITRTQRLYKDVDMLLLAKIRLYQEQPGSNLLLPLEDLIRLFQSSQDDGIVIRVFGLSVNDRVLTLLLGMLASLVSSTIGLL